MTKSGGTKSSSGGAGKGSGGQPKSAPVANLPSTTGNKSGGGRGNAAPKNQ